MKREDALNRIKNRNTPWDMFVIGGGASGLGVALDAASRGFSTLLVERHDFAKGTSSRSTKLVHGGVRYLQQGDISLVFEALRERGLLKKNAPHLVKNLSFVIPSYDWWNSPFYTVGLKVYDMMAGKLGLGPSTYLSLEETIEAIPTVNQEGLRGGVIYQDGQFNDSRMAISIALTAQDYGATLLNYFKVIGLIKEDNLVKGVRAVDVETNEEFNIPAKVVINATGVFSDKVLKMDNPEAKQTIKPSQGTHIVIDKDFLPGDHAIMVPQTSDGRVLFAVPWNGQVLLGTTDRVVDSANSEPQPFQEEVDFILETAGKYLKKPPRKEDIKSVFSGLRPLAYTEGDESSTKEISRHHKVLISLSGLVTIAGGKWTTYRKMAEDTVNNAILVAGLDEAECVTETLHLHGYSKRKWEGFDHVYGTDNTKIQSLTDAQPKLKEILVTGHDFTGAQVVWAVQSEMARTVEDIIARRLGLLFIDAKAAIKAAPKVAELMARTLGYSEAWKNDQVTEFTKVAKQYLWSEV